MAGSEVDQGPTDQTMTAEVHHLRGRLYRTIAVLLRAVPARADLQRLSSEILALSAPGPWEPLGTALGTALRDSTAELIEAEHRRLVLGRYPVSLLCEHSFSAARADAYAEVRGGDQKVQGERGTGDRTEELEIFAELADRTAARMKDSDADGASRLVDLQRSFLSQHGGICFDSLAAEVEQHGQPFYARVGRVLAQLVEKDILHVGA